MANGESEVRLQALRGWQSKRRFFETRDCNKALKEMGGQSLKRHRSAREFGSTRVGSENSEAQGCRREPCY